MKLTIAGSYGQYVVVSPHAIARVERRSEEEQLRAGGIVLAAGAVMGPVLAGLVDQMGTPGGPTRLYLRHRETPPLAEMTDVTTLWAADVPEELTALAGWPRVESHRPVTLYPRRVIAAVHVSFPRGLVMSLRREANAEIALPLRAWQVAKIRQGLKKAGYEFAPARSVRPSAS